MNTPIPPAERKEVARLVHEDIEKRIAKGIAEYGEPLTTHNGRDALWDAYEEALDLAMYLRQAIQERDDLAGRAVRIFATETPV